jgi:Mn2+/Fe2+ NRAMP family transporter
LWTALASFPMMTAVQLMCGRLGMVTGRGLAGVVRLHYPRWVLWGACLLLIVANVINIAADLGGMADATQLVTRINSLVWTPVYAAAIVGFLFWSCYRQIARIFKWMTKNCAASAWTYSPGCSQKRPHGEARLKESRMPPGAFTVCSKSL